MFSCLISPWKFFIAQQKEEITLCYVPTVGTLEARPPDLTLPLSKGFVKMGKSLEMENIKERA